MRRSAIQTASSCGAFILTTGLLVLGSGCASGPRMATDQEAPEAAAPKTWADVETVDLSGRDVSVPVRSRVVEHDVPESLLESRADDGIVEEIMGYRVQVFSSIDRNEALIMLDSVMEWVDSLEEERRRALGLSRSGQEEVARTIFASPYYRVRVGDFRTKDQAVVLRNAMERRFPQLLVVPDQVRVTRN